MDAHQNSYRVPPRPLQATKGPAPSSPISDTNCHTLPLIDFVFSAATGSLLFNRCSFQSGTLSHATPSLAVTSHNRHGNSYIPRNDKYHLLTSKQSCESRDSKALQPIQKCEEGPEAERNPEERETEAQLEGKLTSANETLIARDGSCTVRSR